MVNDLPVKIVFREFKVPENNKWFSGYMNKCIKRKHFGQCSDITCFNEIGYLPMK